MKTITRAVSNGDVWKMATISIKKRLREIDRRVRFAQAAGAGRGIDPAQRMRPGILRRDGDCLRQQWVQEYIQYRHVMRRMSERFDQLSAIGADADQSARRRGDCAPRRCPVTGNSSVPIANWADIRAASQLQPLVRLARSLCCNFRSFDLAVVHSGRRSSGDIERHERETVKDPQGQ